MHPTLMLVLLALIALAILFVPAALQARGGFHSGIPTRFGNQAGSTASFVPEFWSQKLQLAVSKALVFASPTVVNSDYEGEISEAGDVVHINSVGDPTVGTYTGTLTYEDINTADSVLTIDQAKSWSFRVKDIDKAQQAGDLSSTVTQRAAYKLKDLQDQLIESLFAGADSANALGTIQVDTAIKAYDNVLVPLSVKLDEANVPTDGRFVVVPPWFHGRLLKDDRFIRADANGGQGATLGNGVVGSAAGFTIMKSNNCSLITGDDYRISAGINQAITFASQLVETEKVRLIDSFADGVRGLALYGAKLVRPEMVATAIASQT